MEEKRTTITNKHGKKKINPLSSLSIGGEGGIAGLLVFGGALAIAGFMAVASFASKKRKEKGTHDHHQPKPKPQQLLLEERGCKSQEDDHETTQNLTSLLQHSKIQQGDDTCCFTPNMGIVQDSFSELLSAQPLILEEKSEVKQSSVEESPTPTRFHHQEIVFSDYSRPESAVSSNESGVSEECLESLFNHSSGGQAQEVESQDGLTSSETETNGDDSYGEDDMMSDDVSEIEEEDSLKATATTSEAVWAAEAEGKLKGENCVCSDSDADYVGDDEAMTLASLNQKVNMANGKASSLGRSWVFPLLLLAMLLLLALLTRRPQQSFYLPDDGSSVIVP